MRTPNSRARTAAWPARAGAGLLTGPRLGAARRGRRLHAPGRGGAAQGLAARHRAAPPRSGPRRGPAAAQGRGGALVRPTTTQGALPPGPPHAPGGQPGFLLQASTAATLQSLLSRLGTLLRQGTHCWRARPLGGRGRPPGVGLRRRGRDTRKAKRRQQRASRRAGPSLRRGRLPLGTAGRLRPRRRAGTPRSSSAGSLFRRRGPTRKHPPARAGHPGAAASPSTRALSARHDRGSAFRPERTACPSGRRPAQQPEAAAAA